MAHLNSLYEKYRDKGLDVIALSNENRLVVERFIHLVNPKMSYPVAIKAQANYPVSGIPHAFLIGVDGKIVWEGNPGSLNDKTIEAQLKRVRHWRDVAGRRARSAGKSLDRGEFGKALTEAKKVLANAHSDATDKKSAGEIVSYVEAEAQRQLAWANALRSNGHVARAKKILEKMKKDFERTDFGKKAKTALAAIERDKGAKGLLEADGLVSRILRRVKTPAGDRERQAAYMAIQRNADSAKGAAKDFLSHWAEVFKAKWVPKHP